MKHQPERTCIGCRNIYKKNDVVRIVAGPAGPLFDYREKLPGRAAYVCPRRECIQKALNGESLSRALRIKIKHPGLEPFIALLIANILERVKSLISIAAKAGKVSAGYSAVQDALGKGRAEMIIYAEDIAEATKEKLVFSLPSSLREATLFTRDELGRLFNRELVGVIAIEDKGFADVIWRETERLKSLINRDK